MRVQSGRERNLVGIVTDQRVDVRLGGRDPFRVRDRAGTRSAR